MPTLYAGPIVDAHHHLWRFDPAIRPWLAAPGREALARDALPEDHARAVSPHRVVASVFVEALAVDPVAEAAEAQAWADADAGDAAGPAVCTGIVAHCPLDAPDVADRLDRLAEAAPNLRGIRDIVSWRPGAPSFARRGDLLADPAFERGLRVLASRGLVFDLMLLPDQLADAVRLAARLPDLAIVVEHAGSPEDRSDAGRAAWCAGMAALARLPNVAVKLSALQAVHAPGDIAGIAQTIDRLTELFGCDRLAIGTDFPVHDRHCPAAEAIDVFRRHFAGFSAAEQRAVFHDTACRLYRLARSAQTPRNWATFARR